MKQVLATIWNYIRLLAAGCFFFVIITIVGVFLSSVKWSIPSFFVGLGACVGFCLLLWVVFRLFGGKRELSHQKAQRIAADKMDAAGMLTGTDYKARRVFEVEELEDEGKHFYIELEDGSVLFLTGQYLYDYDPDYGSKQKSARCFPCTDFTIKQKSSGVIVKIDCRGEPLKPEVVLPPFTWADLDNGRLPEDGEIIKGRSYEEIKRQPIVRRRRVKRDAE
jgi:hypothetical protein